MPRKRIELFGALDGLVSRRESKRPTTGDPEFEPGMDRPIIWVFSHSSILRDLLETSYCWKLLLIAMAIHFKGHDFLTF